VKAYSGSTDCVYPGIGYVKLNGLVVWRGSWCGRYPNLRGVSTLLIEPFNCTVQESHQFDTFGSADHATRLSNYLQQLNHGGIVVGVTGDEPRHNLDNALPTLQQLEVEVGDVQYRASFGFIAQKGFPTKTVFRKVVTHAESSKNPASFKVTITGWLNTQYCKVIKILSPAIQCVS